MMGSTTRIGLQTIVRREFGRIIVVRCTSPNVPICGSPDGPYPVSNST